jgi:hypothetical protein
MQSSTSGRLEETQIVCREGYRFGLWPKALAREVRRILEERPQPAIAICSYSVKRPFVIGRIPPGVTHA